MGLVSRNVGESWKADTIQAACNASNQWACAANWSPDRPVSRSSARPPTTYYAFMGNNEGVQLYVLGKTGRTQGEHDGSREIAATQKADACQSEDMKCSEYADTPERRGYFAGEAIAL